MPRGVWVEENIYRLPNGTYFWRLERAGKEVSGTALTLLDARLRRDRTDKDHKKRGVLSKKKRGADDDFHSKTVEQAVEEFLADELKKGSGTNHMQARAEGVLRPNTLAKYRADAHRYIYPAIGEVLVVDLKPVHVYRMLLRMSTRGINRVTQSQMRTLLARSVQHCLPIFDGVPPEW